MWKNLKLPLWGLPLVIAVLVAAVGWWGNNRLRATIEDSLKAQLTTTLNANVTALGIWATNQTRLATVLAEETEVRDLAQKILALPRVSRREFTPPPELQQFVEELRPRLNRLGYGVADLVNTNFQIVANSIRPQFFGNQLISDAHTNQFAEIFATGDPVLITPFKPELLLQRRAQKNFRLPPRTNDFRGTNDLPPPPPNGQRGRRGDLTLMQVAAPVRNEQHRVVGALALLINPDKEFSRILSVARSGDSGETYAFDQTGLMISRSRFDEQLKQLGLLNATNTSSALNLRLHDPGGDLTKGFSETNEENSTRALTRLVTSAVDGENEVDVTPSRDYRGVPVVGASCWLPEFGFGVATQLDASEAFRPLRVLQWIFVLLILFLLLAATGMFLLSSIALQRQLNAAELKLKQLGQYTLEEKIGEGGMGVVYRARHALLRRDTAVKLIAATTADARAIERFEREVQLTCQLTHPNTIQVYDYGKTPDGIFYYAMEYLHGVNLHDLVARFGVLPESRVAYILAQICDSLAEAHSLGLIHRDIKPGNIFLCRRGGMADCVKVLDFGLVREFRSSTDTEVVSKTEELIEGTPWFMPPEAVTGESIGDPRSDIYSLGALGYFLLTGNYIFDAETMAEVYEKQKSAHPISPSQRTTQPISREMEELILCCLAKDMNARPQTAEDLRARLATTPFASEWTPQLRAAWWQSFDAQPVVEEASAASAPPLPSVSIDLQSRME
jgi:eukaryotic-like serine/threonine-protein kinase